MNTVIFDGRIAKAAQTRTVNVGDVPVAVTDFTLAVNDGFGDKAKTEFVRCTIWRDRGAKMAQYLTTGREVTVKGSVHLQTWIATKGENAGKAMGQLVVSNPAIELHGKNAKPAEPEDEIPFIPDEELA